MKRLFFLVGMFGFWIFSAAAHAAFDSLSSGALGAFNPTVNTAVLLPDDGVLNYTSVNIPSGITVTFTKNAANTPVYMLATGDVVIAGTISVNGSNGTSTIPGNGGPGGFNGGNGGGIGISGGKGLGPGGGNPGGYSASDGGNGGGGGFGANGNAGGSTNPGTGGVTYGIARLMPLIGGSGGGGAGGTSSYSGSPGGGGGGAIAIASSTTITVTGSITANGGNSVILWGNHATGGGGSGGAIKLISNVIAGNGTIEARGGKGSQYSYSAAGNGGAGRIRIEATTNNRIAPTDPSYTYGLPSSVFVPNVPSLSITSVGGTAPPANPTGNYNQPDVLLSSTTTNPVTVNVSATNIPDGTTVTILVIPQLGGTSSVNTILSGSTASANVNLSTAYSNVITAQATFTVVGMNFNGEEIDKVRVATMLGGKSETTYITKSGKEIKGELVAALMK